VFTRVKAVAAIQELFAAALIPALVAMASLPVFANMFISVCTNCLFNRISSSVLIF